MNSNLKKILLILLLVLLIAGIWRYVTLKRAPGRAGEPITYREFFGLGGRTPAPAPNPGYQSDFLNEDEPDITPETPVTPAPQAPQSAFETPPLSPSGSLAVTPIGSNYFGSQTPGAAGRGSSTGSTAGGNLGLDGDILDPNTLLCDPRDITIEFTPEEIARLNQLDQQLAQFAPYLRSEENVESEISNYENFKIYNDRIVEYKNFCFNKTAGFAVKPARRPTPFWSDPALDTGKFYTVNKAFGYAKGPNDVKSYYFIENFFNMNIW